MKPYWVVKNENYNKLWDILLKKASEYEIFGVEPGQVLFTYSILSMQSGIGIYAITNFVKRLREDGLIRLVNSERNVPIYQLGGGLC